MVHKKMHTGSMHMRTVTRYKELERLWIQGFLAWGTLESIPNSQHGGILPSSWEIIFQSLQAASNFYTPRLSIRPPKMRWALLKIREF